MPLPHRLATFSILGLLAACASDSGAPLGAGGAPGTGGATATGGQSPTIGGTSSSAGGVAPSTGGTQATGGIATTGGSAGSAVVPTTGGNAPATGGTSPGTGGMGASGAATGGVVTGGTGSGGMSTGGASTGGASTGGSGTAGGSSDGDLSITDPVPGFASVEGGTTGGGMDIGSAISVDSMGELQSAAGGSGAAIILVAPGTYSGSLSVGSNKTIIGTGPGVTINGNMSISGSNNVIVRNLAVRGLRCNSYDECRAGDDAVYVGNNAHHVWLDHLDIADGQDGNCDVTQGGDFVTVSWSHFHYTYDKEHRYSNLIASSDNEPASQGKLRITYMNCHWGERVDSRQPRGRFGNIHLLNNYHDTGGGQIHGVGVDMAAIAENCFYDENQSIWTDMGSPRGWRGIGNEGTADNMNDSMGTVFDIPYEYTAMPASQVVAAVTSESCGAGNNCTLSY